MIRRRLPQVVGLLLSLIACACSDSPVDPNDSSLDGRDATALAHSVLSRFRDLSGDLDSPLAAAATRGPQDSITFVSHSEIGQPCEDDRGLLRFARTLRFRIDGATQSGTVDGDVVLSLTQCLFETSRGDRFVVTSRSDLTLSTTFEIANSVPVGDAIDGQLAGSFTWAEGKRAGECNVELSIAIAPDTGSMRARGTFCGATLNETIAP